MTRNDSRSEIVQLEKWNDTLSMVTGHRTDPYFSAEYHQASALHGEGEPFLATASVGAATLALPGMKARIDGSEPEAGERFDLQTCNGYAAPLLTGSSATSTLELWSLWKASAVRAGILAVFLRLYPLLDGEASLPSDAIVQIDRQMVVVDLDQGAELAWKAASTRHRNMVRRAGQSGVRFEWESAFDEMVPLYSSAMDRLHGPPRLRFGSKYMNRLADVPGAEMATARINGRLVAASIFLFGHDSASYHLSARTADAPNFCSNMLLQMAIDRASRLRHRGLLLGGGVTTREDDQLLRFKRSVGTSERPFRVARFVTDQSAFESLCAEWTERSGRQAAWLLPYREPV